MTINWKSLALPFSCFLLGCALTGLALHFFMEKRDEHSNDTDRLLRRLSDQLDLTNAQRASVASLLKEEAPKMETLRKEFHQKSHTLWMAFDGDLRPLLDDSQKKKLDTMEADWRDRNGWRAGTDRATTGKKDGK